MANGLPAVSRGAIRAGRSDVRRHARRAARRGARRDRVDRRRFQVAKHGIYREIPIRYAVGMQQYALRFRLLGVDDGAGKNLRDRGVVRRESGSDPDRQRGDRTLNGPVRYRIRYRVERAILWEGTRAWGEDDGNRDHAVLRWNATGTEWGVPIRRSTVTVNLPRDLDDSQVTYDAWTGVYGAKDKDFTKRRIDARTIAV